MSLLDNYTEDELFQKLGKADAVGDTAAASSFAEMIREKRTTTKYNDAGLGYFETDPEVAKTFAAAGDSSITENVMAGMQAGVGGMMENASRGMQYLSDKIYGETEKPEGFVESKGLGQTIVDNAQSHRQGDDFVDSAAYEFGRVLPGYGAASKLVNFTKPLTVASPAGTIASTGSNLRTLVGQEALRGGISESITTPQDSLESAGEDFAMGAIAGAGGEVLGAVAAPVLRKLVSRGLDPSNTELRTVATNQYKQIKANIDDPSTPTTFSDMRDLKIKDEKGFDTKLTYGDMAEAERKLNFVEELNSAGYKGGLETVKKVMRNPEELELMGIVPSKKETMYSFVSNKVGDDLLDTLGIKTKDLEGVRAEAFKKITESKMNSISKVIAEDPAMGVHLEPLVKAAEAFQEGNAKLSKQYSEQFETDFNKLISSLDRSTMPKETSDFIDDMYSLNRDIKSIRKMVKSEKRTSSELRGITSIASLVGLGFLTHPLAILVAPVVKSGTSKAFSSSVAGSVTDAAKAFRGAPVAENTGMSLMGRAPYEQPWEQGLVQQGMPTTREAFRGSTNPYPSYDPNRVNPIYGKEATGVQFSSPVKADTDFYAGKGKGSVSRYIHDMKNPAVFNADGKPLPMGRQRALIDQARKAGHDYIVIRNMNVGGGSVKVSPEIYVKIGNNSTEDTVEMSFESLGGLLGTSSTSSQNK